MVAPSCPWLEEQLTPYFATNCDLKTLDLTGTDVGLRGAATVSKLLKTTKTLRILLLARSNLGDANMAVIADGIQANECVLNIANLYSYSVYTDSTVPSETEYGIYLSFLGLSFKSLTYCILIAELFIFTIIIFSYI